MSKKQTSHQTDLPASTPADGPAPVIALRKTCDAEGTGLSHYVLMDKMVK
ncbi:MAG: modified peptide precursor CbpA [Alphaproteobacteria bacterium]